MPQEQYWAKTHDTLQSMLQKETAYPVKHCIYHQINKNNETYYKSLCTENPAPIDKKQELRPSLKKIENGWDNPEELINWPSICTECSQKLKETL